MRPAFYLVLTGCGLLTTGCTSADSPDPLAVSSPSSRSPRSNQVLLFKAEYKTTFSFGGLPGQIFVQGTGGGNLLGTGTLTLEEFLNPTVIPNTLTGVALTFVASNGDELHGTFAGTTAPPFPPPPNPPPAIVSFEGGFTISDGTGQFAGATGSGRFRGNANTTNGTGFVAWKGSITFP